MGWLVGKPLPKSEEARGGGGTSVNRLELACSSHRAKLGSRHGDMG